MKISLKLLSFLNLYRGWFIKLIKQNAGIEVGKDYAVEEHIYNKLKH